MQSSILFIAPFEELADTAREVIQSMKLPIKVVIASNTKAVRLAKAHEEASILISRGGTANDLKQQLPNRAVVEVSATFSDILAEIEDAFLSGYRNIGVVTNDNIIDNMTKDFVFKETKVWLRPCKTPKEIWSSVGTLHGQGVDCIIGCHQAVAKARSLCLANKYIQSGRLSIERAVLEALRIEKMSSLSKVQMERLNAVIDNIQEGIVIFGKEKEPVFVNTVAQWLLGDEKQEAWQSLLHMRAPVNGAEQVTTLGNKKLLLKRIPVIVKNHVNDVFVFQETENIEKQERKVRLSAHHKGFYAKTSFVDIFTTSPKMRQVLRRAEKFAQAESNVLIYGETGTGKEGLAQSIHNASARAKYPFVSINCASLPPGLVESELFGYVDGAFTGARRSGKPGLFEMAHKGTIFLDEIGELPLDIQGRLLRVLQEREVMRIGDDKIIPLDIRVICATNKNLHALAKAETFRYDLYYRINVLRIKLPSLAERAEDIYPLLSLYFHQYNQGRRELALTKEAKDLLLRYPWPGNIRELKNIAEVLAFEDDVITANMVKDVLELEDTVPDRSDGEERGITIPAGYIGKDMEGYVLQCLLNTMTPEEVCVKMGISRVTLWRKIKAFQNRNDELQN